MTPDKTQLLLNLLWLFRNDPERYRQALVENKLNDNYIWEYPKIVTNK